MAPEETSWQLKKGRRVYLPIPTRRLERWISEGRVGEDDLVWRSGFSGWKRVSDVEELKSFLKKKAPPAKPMEENPLSSPFF